MAKFSVTLSRQIVFFKEIEIEADNEDAAIEQAEIEIEYEDTGNTIQTWEPGCWNP